MPSFAHMEDSQTPLIKEPLIILTQGRCYGTAISAMLAQHRQFYGLMETQLFTRDTMNAWWDDFGANIHSHGLLRTVATMVFGEQSPKTVNQARSWLWKRVARNTSSIFSELTGLVYPLIAIENTPMVTYRREHMERALALFPQAHFLHLTRHPVAYGNSLLRFFQARAPLRHPNQTAALLRNPESIFYGLIDDSADSPALDPQRAWYLRQSVVASFTSALSPHKHMRIRVEDLMAEPTDTLRAIAEWIGVDSDPFSIDEMMHPERWPFACIGPWNARLGGDPEFLNNPILPTASSNEQSLEDSVPWRDDGTEFKDEVKSLAKEFGYS